MSDTLGSRIRELRLKYTPVRFIPQEPRPTYLTLRGLEKLSGVSNGELCLIENEKIKSPSVHSIYKIAQALGTTVEFLLTGKER